MNFQPHPQMQPGVPPNIQQHQMQQQQLHQQQLMLQQQQQQQQQLQQQQQQQQQQRQDDRFVGKARELVGPLKEKWAATVREAANRVNSGGQDNSRFESNLEELYALCDQLESSLRSAVDCLGQSNRSGRYMPVAPQPTRLDQGPNPAQPDCLPYPQYLATAKQQVAFTNEIKHLLSQASKDVLDREWKNEPSKRQANSS